MQTQKIQKGISVFLTVKIIKPKEYDFSKFDLKLTGKNNRNVYRQNLEYDGNYYFGRYFGTLKINEEFNIHILKDDKIFKINKLDFSELVKDNKSTIKLDKGYKLEIEFHTSDKKEISY